MASKALSIISLILLLVLAISPFLSDAISPDSLSKKASAFEFIKQLQGCHKGEKVKGLHELKKYLERFGYTSYNHAAADAQNVDDDFDDYLELAIKTYQTNHNLNATGSLDAPTVSEMMMPRCGVPDIVKGNARMRSGKKGHHRHHRQFHIVSHYSFMPGNPKWSMTSLTYAFLPGTPSEIFDPVRNAFAKWQSATHFTFSETQKLASANLKIGFYGGEHGDDNPFDGPGGTIAHAFQPPIGHFHYDADDKWSVGASSTTFHLETVALHEIGHLLGLGHSSVRDAIMYSSTSPGEVKNLHQNDIQGIRALYNM